MTIVLIMALFAGCAEEMEPVGEISGVVIDAQTKQPIEKVDVVLTPGNITKETNDEGAYSFDQLEIGTYKLTYSKEDSYLSKFKNINVRLGKNESDVALEQIPPTLSEVHTDNLKDLTETTAIVFGVVSSLGNKGEVTQHGHVWGTSPAPTVSLSTRTDLGQLSKTGSFSSHLTGLSPDTDYYVRAYAFNAAGVAYGNEVAFKTLPSTSGAIPVEKIVLNYSTLTQQVGAPAVTLVTTIIPSAATNKKVKWSTSSPSIAGVTEGRQANSVATVTFDRIGEAAVIATTDDGNIEAYCNVKVVAFLIPVESVELNHTILSKQVDDEPVILVATVRPYNASNNAVIWTSTDPSVATVSSGPISAIATVTFLRAGSAAIVATTEEGDKQAYCNVTVTAAPVPVESVTVIPSSLSKKVGDADYTLSATVLPVNATEQRVTWTSNNSSIASVTSEGKVSFKGVGVATITATVGGKSGSCKVTVTAAEVPVESVIVIPSFLSKIVGDADYTLSVTVLPANATEQRVTWTSNNSSIASVTSEGTVSFKGVGEATITATVGGKSGSCKVTVTAAEVPVESVTVIPSFLSKKVGDADYTLSVTVLPVNATDKSVEWSSSDDGVAPVTSEGTVIFKGVGVATITATVGGKSGKCEVTVTAAEVPVESVTVTPSSLSKKVGDADYTLSVTVLPVNVTDKSVEWSSNNSSIASVTSEGTVSFKGVGVVTITATAGGKSGRCEVIVAAAEVPVESVTVTPSSLSKRIGDEDYTLSATVLPVNATNKRVEWSSNNSSIAPVTSEGKVSFKGAGEATITATTVDGRFTSSCNVTIIPGISGIILDPTSVIGQATDPVGFPLHVTVLPVNTPEDKSVVWTSSNYGVAYAVDGEIFFLAVGTATITATTVVGKKTANCHVTVNPLIMPTGIELDHTSLIVDIGTPITLHATVIPSNANPTIVWQSFTPSIVEVTRYGELIFRSAGTALIRAQASVNRDIFRDCYVTVTP
jgi:uncharacterized protein YjdB